MGRNWRCWKVASRNVYEWDRLGLNEYLYDLGILPYVCSIDHKALTDDEGTILDAARLPGGHFVRYTSNKQGRIDSAAIGREYVWLEHADAPDRVLISNGLLLEETESFIRIEHQTYLCVKKEVSRYCCGDGESMSVWDIVNELFSGNLPNCFAVKQQPVQKEVWNVPGVVAGFRNGYVGILINRIGLINSFLLQMDPAKKKVTVVRREHRCLNWDSNDTKDPLYRSHSDLIKDLLYCLGFEGRKIVGYSINP